MKVSLCVIILTYNESIHINRAINNVTDLADKIIVLDSHSTDDTVEQAKSLGAEVILRKFDNYKNQREYAIQYAKEFSEWILFLDADEYLTNALKIEIKSAVLETTVVGYHIPRRFIFMNKWIKWGGYYPTYLLRLFRPEHASIHSIINEHVKVEGKIGQLKNDFVDHNLKGITNWVEKHNHYASFEAQEFLRFKSNKDLFKNIKFLSGQSGKKQWLRYKIWNNLPSIIRPSIYFIYRYFVRFGFLDGKEGLIYHFLQGFWLWFLVDVKYLEMKNKQCAE